MDLTRTQIDACNNSTAQKEGQPYYSSVRFQTVRSGAASPYTYTINAGITVVGFGYTQGNSMATAGFPSSYVGTAADTNLVSQPFVTNAGHTVYIYGISIEPSPMSNPALLAQVFARSSLVAKFDGTNTTIPLGRPSFYPAAAGLMGWALDASHAGALAGQANPFGFTSNGLPGVDNFSRFPEPLIWQPQGQDSQFRIEWSIARACGFTAADVAASGTAVQAFTSLADGADGTYVDATIRLICSINKPRMVR